jgi:glyoxylase-like metal-dependent hydrolase (beta-lactamase superfamily II)
MKKRFSAVAVLSCVAAGALFAAGSLAWAQAASSPQALAEAAYKVMGMDGVQARTLVISGTLQAWDPGESDSVADPLTPDWGNSTFTQTFEFASGRYRGQWTRPRAGGGMRNYIEIITSEYDGHPGGYVTGIDVNGGQPSRAIGPATAPMHTMSGMRLTTSLRELERNDVVEAMHVHPDRVSELPNQRAGGKSYPAVQYRSDYGTFTVLFDPMTHLPAVVRTRDWDVHAGDSDFDETLSDWRDAGQGVKMPYHQLYTLNGVKIFDVHLNNVSLNAPVAGDAFAAPAQLRGKAAAPQPIGKVPFQWVLRRMGNGFYLDSDALYTDDGQNLRSVDVAPNITFVTGGSHNILIVASDHYLTAFDAPGDDGMSNQVIQMAAQKYPGKPFRYVVLTHHHIDHTGGIRAFSAQGATIVVGKGNGAYFRKALSAPAGSNIYPIKGKPQPKIIEVADKWSVKDGTREIDAFLLDNPHAKGYLIPYVADAKLGWVTDLWNPGGPVNQVNPNLVAIVKGVEKRGIKPERFAGGHGAIGNYADLEKAVNAPGAAR